MNKPEETFGKAPSHVANDYTKYYREELLACWELKFHESNMQRPLKFIVLKIFSVLTELRNTSLVIKRKEKTMEEKLENS
ncbi:hypothetical protein Avbf_16994 [Armadillidium vulgare]|nr:hypothetical protein Avbf_16994 [Armadillidium vulgare]